MADVDHHSMHVLKHSLDHFKVYWSDFESSIKPCGASITATIRQENENGEC